MQDSPLRGLRVLVTRDRRGSERFAERLEELGASAVVCPAIEIRYRNPPGLDEALAGLDRFDWLVLTSANAVRAIAARFEQLGLDPAASLARTRIAVVGPVTEARLNRLGGAAELVASRGDADSLADDLESRGIDRKLVLFPASRIARPLLAQRLREAGAGVVQFSVYETLAPENLAVPGPDEVDVATFASPSAVTNIATVTGDDWFRLVPVVSIGRTTAAAAREAGALEVSVAGEPSMEGLVTALLEFQQRRQQEVEHYGAS